MKVEIDIPKSEITSMLRQVKAWELRKRGQLYDAITTTAFAIEKTAKESMSKGGGGNSISIIGVSSGPSLAPVAHRPVFGRLYSRGRTKKGRKRKPHRASAPGQPPAVDTGRLRSSIRVDLEDLIRLSAEVGTNVEYGAYLERGTPTIRARPWLRPAYEKHIPGFMKEVKKILSTL